MGYSTKTELIQALASAMTSGSPQAPGTVFDMTTVGKLVTDTVNDSQVYQYIKWADENIDGSLSSIYQVPLVRVNYGSYPLGNDITTGDTSVVLLDATRFTQDDVILIRDSATGLFQQVTISDIPNENTLTLTGPMTSGYPALTTRIERIRYPDPIPKMSARLAAAYLYDKHFAAEVEGNETDYGKYLRKLVYQDMNGILAGTVRLLVPDAGGYVGRRYYNHALDDVISTKAKPGDEWFKVG